MGGGKRECTYSSCHFVKRKSIAVRHYSNMLNNWEILLKEWMLYYLYYRILLMWFTNFQSWARGVRGPQFWNFAKPELMMQKLCLQESKSKILCKLVHNWVMEECWCAIATDLFLHYCDLLVMCCWAALVNIVIDHQLKITSIKENK
jgi:hypothetical protein